MRKKLLAALALCAVACSTAAFAAGCDREVHHHFHEYTQEVVDPTYFKSGATHVERELYYYSCTCGEKGFETFGYGLPIGHDYVDGVCSCGALQPTDGLTYKLNAEGTAYAVTGLGDVTETDIIIADYYGDELLPVTEIWHDAFNGCSQITGVVIPNSVKLIDQLSFYGCSGLTSVTVPNSVERIGFSAFGGCDNLTSITLPFVGASAHSENSHLGYIFGAPQIAQNGNYVPASLKTAILSEGCTNLHASAFSFCKELTCVQLPSTLQRISDDAFSCCYALNDIRIPRGVQSIGSSAFWNCKALTRIEIPDSVTSIGRHAFTSCPSLTIYCEAESRPNDWSSNWNGENEKCTVIWGYVIYDD